MLDPPCSLPRELKSCTSKFELWYKNANTSRQLTWLYTNGSVELHMLYTPKKYQFTVNVFQATILCLFNEVDELTVKQIMQKTTMPAENSKAGMIRMCDPKVKLLLKKVNKPTFGDDEPIKPNPKFTSNAIKNNLIPQKSVKRKQVEPTEEEQKQAKQIKRERTFVIQAHCVKVMKAQKSYKYQMLLNDVIRNITMFKAEPPMIKEQIEVLI